MGIAPRDLLRKKEQKYRDLGLKDSNFRGDFELIELMATHPELIERRSRSGAGKPCSAAPTTGFSKYLTDERLWTAYHPEFG